MKITNAELEMAGPRVKLVLVNPDDPSKGKTVIAEIDTGTWLTGVDPRIAEEIGVVAAKEVDVYSTASHEATKQGMAKIKVGVRLDGKTIDLGVRLCTIHPVEPFNQIQALAGRNVLRDFVFTYDGLASTYTLEQNPVELPAVNEGELPPEQPGEAGTTGT